MTFWISQRIHWSVGRDSFISGGAALVGNIRECLSLPMAPKKVHGVATHEGPEIDARGVLVKLGARQDFCIIYHFFWFQRFAIHNMVFLFRFVRGRKHIGNSTNLLTLTSGWSGWLAGDLSLEERSGHRDRNQQRVEACNPKGWVSPLGTHLFENLTQVMMVLISLNQFLIAASHFFVGQTGRTRSTGTQARFYGGELQQDSDGWRLHCQEWGWQLWQTHSGGWPSDCGSIERAGVWFPQCMF